MSKQSKVRVTGAMFASDSHNVRSTPPAKENARRAPFTAAYFGSLRIRSCINKEYLQSPTTVSIAISSCLQLHRLPRPSSPTPAVPPRRLKLSRRGLEFPPSGRPPSPPLLETMRLPIAFAIPRFHRASRAHILLLTSRPLL